ncbi:MAG TPA: DMT family transporter [Casimicrobiaceae bacterium]|nr:DMT family transporter [Casimicrobiaceae bacterium]
MSLLRVRTRRGAYGLLALLTLIWGLNWIAMKFALRDAHPVVLNAERSVLAVIVLFAAMVASGTPLRPPSWRAVLVTALFQTTINFGSTVMALAGGGAGRTSVLVFTMPFWTLVLAWPLLHERVRGLQWLAIALALAGLTLVVDPWHWQGDLTPKLWAILSGFGWAAGTVAMKYFQRDRKLDLLNFIAWQMLIGTVPFVLLAGLHEYPPTHWSVTQALLLVHIGVVATALGFLAWIEVLRWLPAGTASLNLFAIPVIALLSSMVIFDERLTGSEWAGIGCIGGGLAVLVWLAFRSPAQAASAIGVVGEGG